MTDTTTFTTGEFALVPKTRTLRGLVTPYGETGQNALGEFVFSAGSVELPTESVDLWIGHEHKTHLGKSTSVEETARGIEADFEIDPGVIGDRFLAEYESGKKHNLSAEFAALVREGSQVVRSALTGVAAVVLGGFASAAFFELTPEDQAKSPEELAAEIAALAERITELTTLTTPTPEDPAEPEFAATPATPTPEPETPANPESEDAMAEAVAPNTLTVETAEKSDALETPLNTVFELITRAKNGDEAAEFALSDIKISGSGALPAAGVLQPSWLGHLWQGRTYQRKYMPLIRNGVIRSLDEKGFTLDQGSALVGTWAGNKVELPTGTASTAVRSATFQKWGYAADIAREFFDLPGGEEVIDAFIRGVVESYSRKTDEWTLAQIVAGIGSTVAAATYPTEYPAVFGQLIQGAEAIEDAGDTPSLAILNQKAWDQFKYTPKDAVPEFVRFAFNLGGDVNGAGNRIVKGDIGIDDTAAVIVGSAAAAHVNEKAGESPVILDALDIAKGGVDKAVVGYTQFMVDRPASLVRIGTADA